MVSEVERVEGLCVVYVAAWHALSAMAIMVLYFFFRSEYIGYESDEPEAAGRLLPTKLKEVVPMFCPCSRCETEEYLTSQQNKAISL